jgi:hypothetical protein
MIQGLAQDDKRVMDDLRKMFLSNWKKACSKKKGGKTGDKSIIAGPLESVITSFLRNEFREGVEVEKGKIEEISWDVVIKKKKGGSPECLISIKTYIGPGQIRETWASAYLAKRHDRKIKIYMVGIRPADARKPDNNAKRMNDYLNKFPRKGIDKIFYLTTKPYFSSLVKELRGKFTLSRKSS